MMENNIVLKTRDLFPRQSMQLSKLYLHLLIIHTLLKENSISNLEDKLEGKLSSWMLVLVWVKLQSCRKKLNNPHNKKKESTSILPKTTSKEGTYQVYDTSSL